MIRIPDLFLLLINFITKVSITQRQLLTLNVVFCILKDVGVPEDGVGTFGVRVAAFYWKNRKTYI